MSGTTETVNLSHFVSLPSKSIYVTLPTVPGSNGSILLASSIVPLMSSTTEKRREARVFSGAPVTSKAAVPGSEISLERKINGGGLDVLVTSEATVMYTTDARKQ